MLGVGEEEDDEELALVWTSSLGGEAVQPPVRMSITPTVKARADESF